MQNEGWVKANEVSRAAIPTILFLVLMSVPSCSNNPFTSAVVAEADARMNRAFNEYAHGSFASASNALHEYTAFLDANEKRIALYRDNQAVDLQGQTVSFTVVRDIPVTQLVPHTMLANMMIYAGNTNEALAQLSRSYTYHLQVSTRSQTPAVPRTNFVRYIMEARDKIDTKAGAQWKSEMNLDTNFVNALISAWNQTEVPVTNVSR